MFATGNVGIVTFYALIALSILPVIAFVGAVFTHEGRDGMKANPFMFFYYIIFFIFAYYFWMNPILIYEYLGMKPLYQKLIYGALCIVPILEKGLPN